MQVATAEASRRATVLRESCQRYRLALRQLQYRQRRASAGDAGYSVHDAAHQAAPRLSETSAVSSRSRTRTASASAGFTDDTFSNSSLQSDFTQACSMHDSHSLAAAAPRPATAGGSSGSTTGETQPQLSRALCKELAAYGALRTTYLKTVHTDSAVLTSAASQAQCAFMAALNPPPPQPPDADYLQWSPCEVITDGSCSEQGGGQASGNEEPCYTKENTVKNSSDRLKVKSGNSSSNSNSSSSSSETATACAADRSATTTSAAAAAAAVAAVTAAADVIDYSLLQQWVQDELCAVPSGGAAGAAAEGDARAAKGRPSSAASLALLFKDW
jgi:hypothetical protein